MCSGHSTADNCHMGLTLICRVRSPETPGWWHEDTALSILRGLLLTRRGTLMVMAILRMVIGHPDGVCCDVCDLCYWWRYQGTNCLRWGDLNNKQINVLHGPWVWPGSKTEIRLRYVLWSRVQTRGSQGIQEFRGDWRSRQETGREETNNCWIKSPLDRRSQAIFGWSRGRIWSEYQQNPILVHCVNICVSDRLQSWEIMSRIQRNANWCLYRKFLNSICIR